MHVPNKSESRHEYACNKERTNGTGQLKSTLDHLKYDGCKQVFLDGSFATSKQRPNDFDACWKTEGVVIKKLDPVFHRFENGRKSQKVKYCGEFFPKMCPGGSGEMILDFF